MKMKKMNEYNGYYRKKGNKNHILFETTVEAANARDAERYIREDLESQYTLVKVLKK